MKRIISFFLATIMSLSLVACSSNGDNESGGKDGKHQIALVTDYSSIDDKSFNQGSWEGVVEYGDKFNKSYMYYKPTDKSTDSYVNAFQMAANNGAEVIVCPGFLFETAVYKAQDMYPDVKFILLDGIPQNEDYSDQKISDNTYSIIYSEEQSGFLAGYAAVKEGFRDLGFLGGMSAPAVVRFGYGYCQGADYAAKELGLEKGDIKIKYGYTGGFEPMPEYQTKAASWYQSGTEIIFSCAALILNNVTAAAEASNDEKYVIGVDVDQKDESETVITSAMKNLKNTVYTALDEAFNDKFKGGKQENLGVENNAVGLPDDFSRFKNFTKEQYDEIYQKLVDNKDNITTEIIKDTKDNEKISLAQLQEKLAIVDIEEVK